MTRDTDQTDEPEHSDLWADGREEIEESGGDWYQHRYESLKSVGLNPLRKAASVLGLPTDVGREELAHSLAREDCFLGPIGDDTIYQERDGEAVQILRYAGVPGYMEWTENTVKSE